MARGALIGLLHAASLRAEKSPVQDGKALTLMSADVDSVNTSAEMLHETWAQLLEVLVGTTLLARQIGWFALLPLLIVFGMIYHTLAIQTRQKLSNDRVFSNERICRKTPPGKTKGLECCNSGPPLNAYLCPRGDKKCENSRSRAGYQPSRLKFEERRDCEVDNVTVDYGSIQCQWYDTTNSC